MVLGRETPTVTLGLVALSGAGEAVGAELGKGSPGASVAKALSVAGGGIEGLGATAGNAALCGSSFGDSIT
jgi:hypothetical protein